MVLEHIYPAKPELALWIGILLPDKYNGIILLWVCLAYISQLAHFFPSLFNFFAFASFASIFCGLFVRLYGRNWKSKTL